MLPDAPIFPVEHGCAYLQEWLHRLADGDLTGLPRWYTHFHAAECAYCRVAVAQIRELRGVLRRLESSGVETVPGWDEDDAPAAPPALKSLTPERRDAVFQQWQIIAAEHDAAPFDEKQA